MNLHLFNDNIDEGKRCVQMISKIVLTTCSCFLPPLFCSALNLCYISAHFATFAFYVSVSLLILIGCSLTLIILQFTRYLFMIAESTISLSRRPTT